MSTTSISPVAAPAAWTPRARAQHGTARWALARVEARRILAHPVFLLGMAASVAPLADGSGQVAPLTLAGQPWYPAGIALLYVTCLAASRARRDGAQDIYSAGPLAARVRTQAALLSLAAPALAVAALTLVAAIVMAGTDAVLVFEDARYGLRPLELAQGAVFIALTGTLGVLVGSGTKRAYPAAVGALLLLVPPVPWLSWFVLGDGVPSAFHGGEAGGDYNTFALSVGASVGWHLVGLAGLSTLAATAALARHDRRPRVALAAAGGLAAAVAGIALGSPVGGVLL